MEKILSIAEGIFKNSKGYGGYDGWIVVTDKQTINIGISSGQCCCESFGCLMTNDDVSEFIGAKLKDVKVVDTALNVKVLDEIGDVYAGGTMFVNLETNKGLLQFVAYNSHNGYYGHEAVLVSKQLNHSEYL